MTTLHDPTEATTAPDDISSRAVHQLLTEWIDADLISAEQADAIIEHHATSHKDEKRARGFGRMVTVMSTMGAVLVGGGILLVVASNWLSYTPAQRTIIAIVAVVALEVLGYLVRYHTGFHRTGEAILTIGAAAYGGALFVVAQAYNLPLDDSRVFVLWLIPVLPLAYLLRSKSVASLSILVTVGAVAYEPPDVAGVGLVLLALILPLAYVVRSRIVAVLWVLAAFGIVAIHTADWIDLTSEPFLAALTAAVLLGAAVLSLGGVQKDLPSVAYIAPAWEWLGTVTVLLVMFVAGFRGVWDRSINEWIGSVDGALAALYIITALLAATGVVGRTALRNRFDGEVAFTASLVMLAAATSAVFIAAPAMTDVAAFAVANLLLVAALVALVIGGIATARQSLVNVAFLVFGVAVIARYVEIGAGMLGTGMSMIFGGVVLIGLGLALEHFRRTIVARMREAEVGT